MTDLSSDNKIGNFVIEIKTLIVIQLELKYDFIVESVA